MTGGPLAGRRILVTRPAGQSGPLAIAIEEAGGAAVLFPVMRIEGAGAAAVAAKASGIPEPDIAIFVSANAVRYGLFTVGDGTRIAAVGPATAAAIAEAGRTVDIVGGGAADSESLLAAEELADLAGRSVTIFRGGAGRDLLQQTLAARGATVNCVDAYRRVVAEPDSAAVAALDADWQGGRIDAVTVMSVESLEFLLQLLPATARRCLAATPLVAPGERVIKTALRLVPGIPAVAAGGPSPADLVNALQRALGAGQS